MNHKISFLLCLILAVTSFTIDQEVSQLADYDIAKSRDYSLFSSLANCPRSCIEAWSCRDGLNDPLIEVKYVSTEIYRAGGYVGYSLSRNLIIASFKGSSGVENWMENDHFVKQPYFHCLNCLIHSGFYEDYRLIHNPFKNAIQGLLDKYSTAKVLVTGHSLGAALAMIAGIELKRVMPNVNIEIHTFGGPRVGNINLAQYINSKIENVYRVVHNKDIVVHLPSDVDGFNYHHSAYEIFFNGDMSSYKVCGVSGEDKSCSNQYFPTFNIDDHKFYFRNMFTPTC